MKVGILGLGTVGGGVVNVLKKNADSIERRTGESIQVILAGVRNIKQDRICDTSDIELTEDLFAVVNHPEIDVVLELIGGTELSKDLVETAINNGKHVITANKALIAKHGNELIKLANDNKVRLLFEASVAGGIPIIKTLEQGLSANKIESLAGIINGTGNFILSEMKSKGRDFADVLAEAQALGYAESDPTFDIEGIDSAHKIAVLTRLAYGTTVPFDDITVTGISGINSEDIECAREFGYRIKLLAISKYDGQAIDIRVHPAMIPIAHPMANVNGALNAIRICDDMMKENILIGHGAGALPTGSAVVGDVVEIARNILSGVGERLPAGSFQYKEVKKISFKNISEIESEYFLRFSVLDNPGVLSKISGVLGKHSISIESMIQRGRGDRGEGVPLVMMCHKSSEKNIQSALKEIEELAVVCEKSNLIRVER